MNFSSKTKKSIKLFSMMGILSLAFVIDHLGIAAVSKEYIANYEIADERAKIQNLFVDIEASTKVWTWISTSKFAELNKSFIKVFDYLPQDYSFKIVYEQCKSLSQSLASVYNLNSLSSFMDNCHKPFNNIVKKINSSYTVEANASVNPSSWPAPLTVTFDWTNSKDPSKETIPEKNYFWYFRDVDWVDKAIWNWSIIKYTFQNPWTYLVHLTVRSSNSRIINKTNDGVFDWEKTISINVAAKSAIINVYANWKQLNKTKKSKIW